MKNDGIGNGGAKAKGGGKMQWAAAAFLVFLGVDLLLFGNCVIPPQDAAAVPVKPGVVELGAQGMAILAIPSFPSLRLRTGLNGETDVGVHADYEILGDGPLGYYDDGSAEEERFDGGDFLGLGFDVKRSIAGAGGGRLFTLQGGLTYHGFIRSEHNKAAVTGLAGILLGNENLYGGPRVHVGLQSSDLFYQLEFPLAARWHFFRERLGFEVGFAPSVFIAEGHASAPWPWQYVGLQWRFGG